MHFEKLTEEDLFGRFFLKASDGGRFSGYYESLDAIRPLIRSQDWLDSVSGFYINFADKYDAVRLSFFTANPKRVIETVEHFIAQNNLENTTDPEMPHHIRISEPYGNEELRFRRYLSTYTQIGLDIMEEDLLNARCLFATFRWQVMIARKSYEPHFSKTFKKQSPFYNSLSLQEYKQFWSDFSYWPNRRQVDWAHLFVNMALGSDWDIKAFLRPQPPLPIREINVSLKREEMSFQIPENWHSK